MGWEARPFSPKRSGPAQKGSIERNQWSRGPLKPEDSMLPAAVRCSWPLVIPSSPALCLHPRPPPQTDPHPEPDHFLPTPTPSCPCYLWILGIEECPIFGAEN
ncbi:unnamed protein product [Rangifer tarandus platyrhynchus]|uniref:Uncharacterized protein n=2 Tax=Rangifer tarandus platyrhynchus TaxID=3082113 RepID=A0ABN8YV17_RANTA|nr:unnamed protein product [Rangifer tarandus platyrhynchus]